MLTEKQKHRFYLRGVAKEISKTNEDGVFIECGVKYGTSSVIMAQELQCKGYLFDTWDRRESITTEDGDEKRIRKIRKKKLIGARKKCKKSLIKNGVYNLCELIDGDICQTLSKFFNNNSSLNVRMAHLDTDLFLSTKIALELIWPRLTKNGAVFVHDYRSLSWTGVEKAVNQFIQIENTSFFSYSDINACIIKLGK